jgi:hypothetical protein
MSTARASTHETDHSTSHHHAPAMQYKSGGRASALYAAFGVQNLTGQADLATQYITGLKNQAAQVLGTTIGANLSPIQYNGDFNWSWTDGINFNAPTYNYVSGAVTPSPSAGTYQIGGAGSLNNLYQQLINGITWKLSAADNATIQQAMTQSQTQATSIVQTYVSIYGAPTAAQMQVAQQFNSYITQPFDYILLYLVGYLWAGKPTPALTLKAMQNAPNLSTLLQYAPPSAQPIIMALPAYLNAIGAASGIMDAQVLGGFTLQQIKNNLLGPSATNGGITQFNPPSSNYFAGYFSNMTPSEILQDLGNTGQSVTMSFSAAASSSSSYNISFSGQAGLNWGGDLLDISAGTSFRGDVARQQGAGSTMSITMVYPGVTVIPLFPTAWQQSSGGTTGWWYEPIIFQAWKNFQAGSAAPSGFTFGNAIPGGIQLGQNGTGYLHAVVVSGYPTITVEFTSGNYSQFSSWLSTHTTVSVSLFGFIPLGSTSVDTYTASASQSSGQSGFTLTLTPPAPGSSGQTIPVASQTVPVLAGQISWLGATQS